MNESTGIALVVINGAGLVILIGFTIAAFVAYKKSKELAKAGKHKVRDFIDVTDEFLDRLRRLAED